MSLQVPPDIESQIEAIANLKGETATELVREALVAYLEDWHDAEFAAERLKSTGERRSLDEIGRKHGLVD